MVKDTVYYVSQINGKWGLVKTMDETKEGWSPIDYLQEVSPHSGTKSPPPAPPMQQQQQQQQQPAVSQQTNSNAGSATSSNTTFTQSTNATLVNGGGSLGNNLADALKAKNKKKHH